MLGFNSSNASNMREPVRCGMARLRVWLYVAALTFAGPGLAQTEAGQAVRLWLQVGGASLPVVFADDMDLGRALQAWTGRHDDLTRFAGRWLTDPAPLPWNDMALSLIVKYQQNPLRAARALALLHAAMDDAVVTSMGQGAAAIPQAVAAHAAASAVLDHLLPQ